MFYLNHVYVDILPPHQYVLPFQQQLFQSNNGNSGIAGGMIPGFRR
jgi:hypothetical protein